MTILAFLMLQIHFDSSVGWNAKDLLIMWFFCCCCCNTWKLGPSNFRKIKQFIERIQIKRTIVNLSVNNHLNFGLFVTQSYYMTTFLTVLWCFLTSCCLTAPVFIHFHYIDKSGLDNLQKCTACGSWRKSEFTENTGLEGHLGQFL